MGSEEKKIGKHHKPEQKAEQKIKGTPFAVTALLVVLALACGCVSGYFVGTNFSDTAKKLEDAQARIEEYEIMVAEIITNEYENGVQADAQAAAEQAANDGSAALTGQNVISPEAAEIVAMVEYNGGSIMSDEVAVEFERALADYAILGQDMSESTDAILYEVLVKLAKERIAYMKAEELGLTQYSESDQREMDALAQSEYDSTVSFHAGDNADEAATLAAQQYLADSEGYTLEAVRAEIERNYWQDKLYAHVTASVTVDADDIAALYNQRVAEQQEEFDADPTAFETALMGGEIVVYNPAGYRTVKQIFIALDEASAARVAEINAQLAEQTDEAVIAELNAELDSIYAPLETEANQAVAEFESGADFDALIEQYGDAGALSAGAFSSTGYYISANTVIWPAEFVEAGMALAAPGDVSSAVRSSEGVHVVRYIANVESGAIPLSNVSSRLTTETRDVEMSRAYDEQLQAWMEEAGVQYYPERMN